MRGSQSGIIDPRLYIYGGIVIAIAAGGGYLTYRWMSDEVHTAQREAQDAKQSLKAQESLTKLFQGDLNEANAAVDEKGERLKRAQATNQGLNLLLNHVQQGGGSDATYLAGAMPASIRRLRRIGAGCTPDLSMPCAGKLDAGDTGTRDAGRNDGASAFGSGGVTDKPTPVQR